jgi:hypothetical protein
MRIFDFVGFFCSRRSWHHGIWRPGRSKRGRQYSIGEAVGMHQPKTAGCSQPFAVGSGQWAPGPEIDTCSTKRPGLEFSSLQIPRGRACPVGPDTVRAHCTHSLHRDPMHSDRRPLAGNVACCCHVAATVSTVSAPFPPHPRSVSVPSISRRLPLHPLHLEHQRRDASVIPEPSIRTRSAIVFPSSDACCAKSCHEAE